MKDFIKEHLLDHFQVFGSWFCAIFISAQHIETFLKAAGFAAAFVFSCYKIYVEYKKYEHWKKNKNGS